MGTGMPVTVVADQDWSKEPFEGFWIGVPAAFKERSRTGPDHAGRHYPCACSGNQTGSKEAGAVSRLFRVSKFLLHVFFSKINGVI